MPDKYDEHIEAILSAENPQRKIDDDWSKGVGLFEYLTGTGRGRVGSLCGCPVMVKGWCYHSHNHLLDSEVTQSHLIPTRPEGIRPDRAQLEEFARIQRLKDKIYNREVA